VSDETVLSPRRKMIKIACYKEMKAISF